MPLAIASCVSDAPPENKAPSNVRFECETHIDDATGSPFSEAYLLVADHKIKIADIGSCEPLTHADYATFQIPDTALSACGGAGDYLFVVRQEKTLVVFQGNERFDYRVVYRMKND